MGSGAGCEGGAKLVKRLVVSKEVLAGTKILFFWGGEGVGAGAGARGGGVRVGVGGGGGGRDPRMWGKRETTGYLTLHCHHNRMISASRWAAVKSPLMFSVVVEDTVTKTVSISHNTLYDSVALGRGAFGSHYNKTDASVQRT